MRNAAMTFNAHDNANMVAARGLRAHGVILRHDRPCVSAAAARFLADGQLPDAKLTHCKAPATPLGP
ncbi:alpha/beta hydrolase [Luteibacter yeojuensis]